MKDLICASIYKKIIQLVPNVFKLRIGTGKKSKVSGYMDLNLDILEKGDDFVIIALSHYYKSNGDMVADPDMEIKVYQHEIAEALAYQDTYFYRRVYTEEGKMDIRIRNELNGFLNYWLANCLNQGHKFNKE